jgi:hypothetical protein
MHKSSPLKSVYLPIPASVKAELSLKRYFLQYSIFRGNCPTCKEQACLLVYPQPRRGDGHKQGNWSFCTSCRHTDTIESILWKKNTNITQQYLWQLHKIACWAFDSMEIPGNLVPVLNRYGISFDERDPSRKMWSGYIGMMSIKGLINALNHKTILIDDRPLLADRNKVALVFPVQKHPGYIIGYQLLTEEGVINLPLHDYRGQGYLYLSFSASGKKVTEFPEIQDALEGLPYIVLSGEPTTATVPVNLSRPAKSAEDNAQTPGESCLEDCNHNPHGRSESPTPGTSSQDN